MYFFVTSRLHIWVFIHAPVSVDRYFVRLYIVFLHTSRPDFKM